LPLTLPNLDDVTWEQLNDEARALIPAYAPDWTNHNPSDPGITLVELFAHFSEMLLYRLDRIGDPQTINFLRLLNGLEWSPRRSLDQEKRATVLTLRRPMRAVTEADYEALALAASEHPVTTNEDRVARAKCIAERNLDNDEATAYNAVAPGHITVVVVPSRRHPPTKALLRRVKHTLHAAKLLTTQVHVAPPRFVTFGIQVTVVPHEGASAEWVQSAALNRLEDFFDPLHGGLDEKGWPFGRSVYVSEVYQLLGKIPGVDYVTRSKDAETGEDRDELFVAPSEEDRLRFNSLDELEAIEVHHEELVALWVTPEDIVIDTKASRR
jgi:Baseplate J-like protein